MVKSIPRFEISYGPAAFAAACRATLAGEVPPARDLASVLGDRQLIWTGSGSQALSLVLVALKLGRGARVAIPLFSPAAVATAVEAAGCQPLYVDVDPRTLTMDPREVARVRERVAAIVPVHLFGNVAEMDRLMDAARRVPVIEDTVQCVTGSWRGRRAGTFGVASFYSFGPAKCIAAGAGGLLAVNGTALAADMRQLAPKLRARKKTESLRSAATQLVHSMLSSHGLCRLSAYRDEHSDPVASVDAHAIPPSAAAAVPQLLRGFAGRMHRQRDNSLRLIDFLRPASGVVLPIEPASAIFCYTFFPVLVSSEEERDALRLAMLRRGVDTSAAYRNCAEIAAAKGYRGSCPVSEHVAQRALALPNSASLTSSDIERVASVFLDSLKSVRAAGRVRQIFEAHAV